MSKSASWWQPLPFVVYQVVLPLLQKIVSHLSMDAVLRYCSTHQAGTTDVIYYYVIWTDSGNMLPEANTRKQEGRHPAIKVLQGCILKLLLHFVNSVPILYRKGNMQSPIFLSFVVFSSLPPCGPNLHTRRCPATYISPYVVYNVYGRHRFRPMKYGNHYCTYIKWKLWTTSGFVCHL